LTWELHAALEENLQKLIGVGEAKQLCNVLNSLGIFDLTGFRWVLRVIKGGLVEVNLTKKEHGS
jgi:hypothetical protein